MKRSGTVVDMDMSESNLAGSDVVDVTDATFVDEVIEESKSRPVVVDFWAEWCAPCRTLGPILEKLAVENDGAFRLAKVDVDANPGVAAHFMVQGIPSVKAFRGGELVDEFVGAMPEPMVRKWLEPILPTEADLMAAEAQQEVASGDLADAEDRFREALKKDHGNREAVTGLARLLIDRGDLREARELVEPLVPDPVAASLLSAVRVAEWAGIETPGTLASAKRLASGGHWREALDGMLGALGDDPDAREAMLDVFAVLGDDDAMVRDFRAKLASALF
jgi:putative thioredoxin